MLLSGFFSQRSNQNERTNGGYPKITEKREHYPRDSLGLEFHLALREFFLFGHFVDALGGAHFDHFLRYRHPV